MPFATTDRFTQPSWFDSLPFGSIEAYPRNEKPSPDAYEYVEISGLQLENDGRISFEWTIATIPEPKEPDPSKFYHAIQASSEFQAIDSWAISNAIEPAATLLNRAMSVVLEAKAYADQFGANSTSFAAMQSRLNQFVESLDDATDYGGTNKAAIVDRIIQAVTDGNLPITITLTV